MNTIQPLDLMSLKSQLVPRPKTAYKGDFGTLLIIGGSPGMSGSIQMAGEAALRVGVGKVIIATHPDHATTLNVTCPELMVHAVTNEKTLLPLLDQATHLLIGPGLEPNAHNEHFLQLTISTGKPCVFDAGALTMLAKKPVIYQQGIFTPHPGEAARLLGSETTEIQRNRVQSVQHLQTLLGGIAILKGHDTLICDEKGNIVLSPYGNPGMATAGMGDILSGVIAGLWPQTKTALLAAQLGVTLHGCAGDKAAAQGERGLIATDLLPYLRTLLD